MKVLNKYLKRAETGEVYGLTNTQFAILASAAIFLVTATVGTAIYNGSKNNALATETNSVLMQAVQRFSSKPYYPGTAVVSNVADDLVKSGVIPGSWQADRSPTGTSTTSTNVVYTATDGFNWSASRLASTDAVEPLGVKILVGISPNLLTEIQCRTILGDLNPSPRLSNIAIGTSVTNVFGLTSQDFVAQMRLTQQSCADDTSVSLYIR